MSDSPEMDNRLPPEMLAHYQASNEVQRLSMISGQLELVRSREIVQRYAPPPPTVVLDIGGAAGMYSCWLARLGYEVHLIDPLPLHVEQAREASASQPDAPLASATVGEARQLDRADNSVDLVLLFGPLYHLIERKDRLTALGEARRVLRPGGLVLAVGISRFASTLDGLVRGFFDDPVFVRIAQRDLADGQHRNPSDNPIYFTTAFFHHPDELRTEIEQAGLCHRETLPIEGPGWLLQNFDEQWRDPARRQRLLNAIRWLEKEPSLVGVSAHLIAVAGKDPGLGNSLNERAESHARQMTNTGGEVEFVQSGIRLARARNGLQARACAK